MTELPSDLEPLERSLLRRIAELEPHVPSTAASQPLDPTQAALLFEAQVRSRLLDHTARWLRTKGEGYYTIGSAGHEANAAVALALRPTDPALLHYRSGGFYVARASQVPGQDAVSDVLRGLLARTTEPISGGRHKVFGSVALNVLPQTSTIGSHLPRAVGLAISCHLGDPGDHRWPADSVVVCSFGDASLNHSTAQGALNFASYTVHAGRAAPVLFVCEDNGLGISVSTPDGWVAASTRGRPHLTWRTVDGSDPSAVFEATASLAADVRATGRPGLLHLRTVRYLGHAGTDVESAYRTPAELRADEEHDPILGTARLLVGNGGCSGDDLVAWYLDEREVIRLRAEEVRLEPEFGTAEAVMAPLAPRRPDLVATRVADLIRAPRSSGEQEPVTLAQAINGTLDRVLQHHRRALVFGEDVGRKGGVYGVTRGLQKAHGTDRVFDTLLDEQSILGLALGAGVNGLLPIPEIQYLAYLHNAEDQLRGEAASLSFFSNGQLRNPMVVRIAGYGYQKGFGGHFHNDNAIAVLRDIPGLVIASPSHPSDAGPMLETCVAAADVDGSVCVYLEPIALYHTSDLYDDGDGLWLGRGDASDHVPIGAARAYGDGGDLTILTWGNGLFMSLRSQARLAASHRINARVVDLRWLAPLPTADIVAEAEATGRVLVVDETRSSGGVGEGVIAALVEHGARATIRRVAGRDTFVPLGAAAALALVSEREIDEAAIRLLEEEFARR